MANTFLGSNFSHGASVDTNRGSGTVSGTTGIGTSPGGTESWGGLGAASILSETNVNSTGIATTSSLVLTLPASQGSTTAAIKGAVERIRPIMAALRAAKEGRFTKLGLRFSGGN